MQVGRCLCWGFRRRQLQGSIRGRDSEGFKPSLIPCLCWSWGDWWRWIRTEYCCLMCFYGPPPPPPFRCNCLLMSSCVIVIVAGVGIFYNFLHVLIRFRLFNCQLSSCRIAAIVVLTILLDYHVTSIILGFMHTQNIYITGKILHVLLRLL